MARYIDADALIEKMQKSREVQQKYATFREAKQTDFFIGAIKTIPAADLVEVVRCKECKRCELRYPAKAIGEEATEGYWCHLNQRYVKSTDFCSGGERKE